MKEFFAKLWAWLTGFFASPAVKAAQPKEVDLPAPPVVRVAGTAFTKEKMSKIFEARCAKGESTGNIKDIRALFAGPPANFDPNGLWASCAAGVTWAAREAGLDIPIQIPGSWATYAYVPEIRIWAVRKGFWQRNFKGYVPPVGAWAIFEWNRTSYDATDWDGDENHIGIVRADAQGKTVFNGQILTSEANVGGKLGNFARNPVNIVGYVIIPDHYSFAIAAGTVPPATPQAQDMIHGTADLSKGFAIVKEFEGCELEAYPDPATKSDPWTIGWGHTGSDVYPGLVITQARAEELFQQDMKKFVDGVKRLVVVPMTNGQFSALVSFSYNCGLGALGSSSLLKYFNQGQVQAAADEFPKWNKAAGNVMAGLTRRRKAERELFLS